MLIIIDLPMARLNQVPSIQSNSSYRVCSFWQRLKVFDSHWRPPAGEGRGRERGRGRRDEKRGREGEMRRDKRGEGKER